MLAPCVFMIFMGGWRLFGLRAVWSSGVATWRRRADTLSSSSTPSSWTFLLKMLGSGALSCASAGLLVCSVLRASADDSGNDVGWSRILSSALLWATSLLAWVVHWVDCRMRLPYSFLLITYWIMVSMCSAIQLRSMITIGEIVVQPIYSAFFVAWMGVAVGLIFLEHIPTTPLYQSLSDHHGSVDEELEPCPEETANYYSVITFSWINDLLKSGFRRTLTAADLWDLRSRDKTIRVDRKFDAVWKAEMKKPRPSFVRALNESFGAEFWLLAIYKIGQDVLGFVQPQLLSLLIAFISSYQGQDAEPDPISLGFLIAFVMPVAAILQSILLHQYFHGTLWVGMNVRSAVIAAVYRKALCLSSASRRSSTVGEIVNLMSVDAQRLLDLTAYLHLIWSSPLQIALSLYFLFETLGPATFAGLGVMIVSIPINGWLAVRFYKLEQVQMENKDRRTKLTDEVLNGIKVIKLYSWESIFINKVASIRGAELRTMKSLGYLNSVQSFFWNCIPFMVSFSTFAVYAYTSPEPLTAQKVFVSLTLFNMLRFPLFMFPDVISSILEASVSVARLRTFLLNEELEYGAVVKESTNRYDPHPRRTPAVRIVKSSFKWKRDGNDILKEIDLDLRNGTILAVVGKVGSGKSSLISAILGEMYRSNEISHVRVTGELAYVGQQAWIMNASLRDNILFNKPYDAAFYEKVVEACGLKPDFSMLPGADLTEIGERGINLSGGQRQRVSLARAVYSRADIYLLDDPLSAVDAHVGRHIFNKVFGHEGLLRTKSRLFVTHAIQYLPGCDQVLMLDDGCVVAGPATFSDLVSNGVSNPFHSFVSDFIKDYESSHDEKGSMPHIDSPDIEMLDDIARSAGITLSRSLRSHVSTASISEKQIEEPRKPKSIEMVQPIQSQASRNSSSPNEEMNNIISQEEVSVGSVSWSVYKTYLLSCGLYGVLGAITVNILSQLFSVGSNVWLKFWSDASTAGPTDIKLYLGVYGGFGLAYALSVILQSFMVFVVCAIRSSRTLHRNLLRSVLRSPMSFFDTTPLGRVMNRFSKDLYTVDEVLPRSFMSFMRTSFNVFSTVLVITASTPLFLVLVIPMGIIYFSVQRYYIASSRSLKRLDSVSRSPICQSLS